MELYCPEEVNVYREMHQCARTCAASHILSEGHMKATLDSTISHAPKNCLRALTVPSQCPRRHLRAFVRQHAGISTAREMVARSEDVYTSLLLKD